MHLTRRPVAALRLLLALTFAALLMAQLRALPAIYDDWLRSSPERPAGASLLLLLGGVLVLLCVQVVVICTWRLLSLVQDDRIFSERSFAWVDAVLVATGTGSALLLTMIVRLVGVGGPVQLVVALSLVLLGGAVAGLLLVVMRALLRQATTLRADWEAVI